MTLILTGKLKPSKNKKTPPAKPADLRPIDAYINQYTDSHQHPTNKLIQYICVPLFVFSLLGLTWAVPFPYLKFLGEYNSMFNWSSFLIAGLIYYYYKLAPVLSYFMLLVLFAFSYGVSQLSTWQTAGGLALWLVSIITLLVALTGQFIGSNMEGKKQSLSQHLKLLFIGPAWMLHFVLKKLSVKY